MAKSTRDRFYEKLGIATHSADPVPLEENYFRILGLSEDLSDIEILARARTTVLERQREVRNYGHIDRAVSGAFSHLVSEAGAKLGSPGEVSKHRRELLDKRTEALEQKVAWPLQKSGATAKVAQSFLEERAADYGVPKTRIDDTVREILRRVGPWPPDPVSPKPTGGPGPAPPRPPRPASWPTPERMPASVLIGSLAGLFVLGYLWSGLAMFLAVGAAGFGAWMAWRTRDMRVAA